MSPESRNADRLPQRAVCFGTAPDRWCGDRTGDATVRDGRSDPARLVGVSVKVPSGHGARPCHGVPGFDSGRRFLHEGLDEKLRKFTFLNSVWTDSSFALTGALG